MQYDRYTIHVTLKKLFLRVSESRTAQYKCSTSFLQIISIHVSNVIVLILIEQSGKCRLKITAII